MPAQWQEQEMFAWGSGESLITTSGVQAGTTGGSPGGCALSEGTLYHTDNGASGHGQHHNTTAGQASSTLETFDSPCCCCYYDQENEKDTLMLPPLFDIPISKSPASSENNSDPYSLARKALDEYYRTLLGGLGLTAHDVAVAAADKPPALDKDVDTKCESDTYLNPTSISCQSIAPLLVNSSLEEPGTPPPMRGSPIVRASVIRSPLTLVTPIDLIAGAQVVFQRQEVQLPNVVSKDSDQKNDLPNDEDNNVVTTNNNNGSNSSSGGTNSPLGSSQHPHNCKPCAFRWTKGCVNGDTCPFCHEWHPPRKKKPMKDQKNLMIIARRDGKIEFLRCSLSEAIQQS